MGAPDEYVRMGCEVAVELEEEGAVIYANSFYISHIHNRRQDSGRPLRLDGDFRSWTQIVIEAWQDFFDHNRPFTAHLVEPDPPVPITQGFAATLLIVQHPQRERALV